MYSLFHCHLNHVNILNRRCIRRVKVCLKYHMSLNPISPVTSNWGDQLHLCRFIFILMYVELADDLMVSWLWSRETIWLEAGFTTSTVGPPFRAMDLGVLCQVLKLERKNGKSEFYRAGSEFFSEVRSGSG